MSPRTQEQRKTPGRVFTVVVLGAALIVACFASLVASGAPDGLEYVADQTGFGGTAQDHALAASPFADYATAGLGDSVLSTVIVGAVGCSLTFLLAWAIGSVAMRRRSRG